MTSKKIRDRYTDDSFVDAKAFEDFLRSGKELSYDYVIVAGVLYTMHEYDMDGKTLTWANEKHSLMLDVDTTDRYRNGYKDACVVGPYSTSYLRNDIVFAD